MRKKYEVGLYNKEVRDALADGVSHKHLDDEWADIHWIEVMAPDEQTARERIQRRYNERTGYVIVGVQALA
ncbi:MAG: hypothetical protein JKY20_11465 [Alphaproteobacteria bacterium]|nr:hypothetical protein [Alphaproteobacteria bacterium]